MRHRPLVNSLGTYRKEAQVLPLKTYADKKRSLIFILGQRTDSGENQHGQVHSDHWCLRPPSGVLLGLLWGSCPESAFSQISQLFESYHPSNRKGNQWLERWSLKCGPQTSSISITWELVRAAGRQAPPPDLLLHLSSPPGDSDTGSWEPVGSSLSGDVWERHLPPGLLGRNEHSSHQGTPLRLVQWTHIPLPWDGKAGSWQLFEERLQG